MTVTVTPQGADDAANTSLNTPVAIDVLANDPSGPSLTVTSVTDPPNGSVVINDDGTVTYTAVDEEGQPVTQTVTVTVTPEGGR